MPVLRSINGVSGIKEPTDFTVSKYDLTKSGRLANGDMVIELVAKKRKFQFSYAVLSGPQLDLILSAIDTEKMLFEIQYIENNKNLSAIVYRGAVTYRKFRTDGRWYWKDVTFDLIER